MLSSDFARIRSFEVVPSLPEALGPLMDIAHNLWWSWHPEAVQLFMRLDRKAWNQSHHNPVKMLGMLPQDTLEGAAHDEGFLTSLKRVQENLDRHMQRQPWLQTIGHDVGDATIAYFCAEFGLTECLPIYSGGLGCLAGDHLKSASELGLPFIAVGLLYRNGYFQQHLSADGWQQESAPDLDFANLPIKPLKDGNGEQVKVCVRLPGREVVLGLWRVNVGRIPLYLLDTNLPENEPDDRWITGQLYGGDMETRIKQEVVLGIGGVRALRAIGITPDVCHMNEGHSAFLALERIRHIIAEHDLSFDEAREQAAASHVFTTHTPVPAGIDRFPPELVERYLKDYIDGLRLDMEGTLALGRDDVTNRHEPFSMATLAIRTSGGVNGVAKLHGEVARRMWRSIWPGVPEEEVPIGHVTNGCHARSWLSADLINLLDRYLGARWQNNPVDQSVWKAINEVPDEELWRLHESRRQSLIVWARKHLKRQMEHRGVSAAQTRMACDALSDRALTIGFARRFATYKRGNLILRDTPRLLKMLEDADRPIQFIIAGKSHPADGGGKDLIRQIVRFAEEHPAGRKVVFLENYDIHMARCLVQGCDVWLNNPRRPMEASGTSGMKAALNGCLNCSVLDGWWDEAYEEGLGWAIGRGEEYENHDLADDIESRALYDLLEHQILPMFYDRDDQGVPRTWVRWMKKCISTLAPRFNTNRMVQEYAEHYYLPALHRARELSADTLRPARELALEKKRLRQHWGKLAVQEVRVDGTMPLQVRQPVHLHVDVCLGELRPDEVHVQAYLGRLDNNGHLVDGAPQELFHAEDLGGGKHRYTGQLSAANSGSHGFAIRIRPGGGWIEGVIEPGLIYWEPARAPVVEKKKPTKKKPETASP